MRIDFTLFNRDSVRRILLTCLVLFTAITASAFEVDGITYNILETEDDSNQVEVGSNTSYTGAALTLPSTATDSNGNEYTVTSICTSAFSDCTSLESVDISACTGLTTIGASAFKSCTYLTTINLPSNLETIGDYAFSGCPLTSVISLASTAPDCGTDAFFGIASTCTLYYTSGASDYTSSPWNAFTAIVVYDPSFTVGGISYNVTDIINFYVEVTSGDYSELTEVTLPSTATDSNGNEYALTSIGDQAFAGRSSLKSVDFSQCTSFTSIGELAFNGCTSLESVNLSQCTSLTSIGDYAFGICRALTSVTLPSTLESVGNYIFIGCKKLEQLVCLATSVPSCGAGAFESVENCTPYALEGYKDSYIAANGWEECFNSSNTKEITPITIGSVGVTAYSHVQTTDNTYLPDFSNVLDLGDSQSVKAYTISKVVESDDESEVGKAYLTEFTGTLAEKEGLIIKNDNDGACTVYAVVNESTDAETVSDDNNDEAATNYLKATTGETLKNAYVFGYFTEDATDLGFYYFNSIKVEAGKAYLDGAQIQSLLSEANGGNDVKSIIFVYDDDTDSSETTGISEVATSEQTSVNDDVYYNLSGMRINTPTKGIYIVNGKKVIIK